MKTRHLIHLGPLDDWGSRFSPSLRIGKFLIGLGVGSAPTVRRDLHSKNCIPLADYH